ncbi:MAG: metalloregulator ArsR/SmtB family transcription factor [Clostridia bacterium]|nr:metalloregulator ArsR/SmtB family transcription factor [Clostridia bacterium]
MDKNHNHEKILEIVRSGMLEDTTLNDLSNLFKIFGDFTRIKILYSLFESEMCVCAIAEIVNMSQSAVSHQLKVLKDANLIKNRREGKTIFYSLADEHVRTIIGQGLDHILEDK